MKKSYQAQLLSLPLYWIEPQDVMSAENAIISFSQLSLPIFWVCAHWQKDICDALNAESIVIAE